MTTRAFRRVIHWVWQGATIRELARHPYRALDRHSLQTARSSLLLSWRILAGVEPVPYAVRGAVAMPLLDAGMRACVKLVEPSRASFDELFDIPEWQRRFEAENLREEQQLLVKKWLNEPTTTDPSVALARSALLALRAALDVVHEPERGIRRVLCRRLVVLGTLLLSLVGVAAGLHALLVPPRPTDIAAGRPWKASSAYVGFSLEGSKPVNPSGDLFFSTNDEMNPWLSIDLQSTRLINGASLVNRADCCSERAHPLALEVSLDGREWREVSRREQSFSSWDTRFRATRARYVRVRCLRRTFLHLKDVEIYAAPG